MRAGRLDRLVELRHRLLTRDPSSGQQVESWPSAYASVWAQKVNKGSRRFYAAQQANAEISELFLIRFRSDVVSTDRLYLDGLEYRLSPPIEVGRREGLELPAIAVSP